LPGRRVVKSSGIPSAWSSLFEQLSLDEFSDLATDGVVWRPPFDPKMMLTSFYPAGRFRSGMALAPIMSQLHERVDRVRIIAHTLHGNVLDRDGDVVTIEVPADLSDACASMLGAGGFSAVIVGQNQRLAPRMMCSSS
jgi:hypothetical protein